MGCCVDVVGAGVGVAVFVTVVDGGVVGSFIVVDGIVVAVVAVTGTGTEAAVGFGDSVD